VNATFLAEQREGQGRKEVVTDVLAKLPRLLEVIDGPTSRSVRPAHQTDNAIGFQEVQLGANSRHIIRTSLGARHDVTTGAKKGHELTTDPAATAENETGER
jgi:hypothetical protein